MADLFARDFTMGEFVNAVLEIADEAEARAFYERYLAWLTPRVTPREEAPALARSNIGWCFGEGMAPERIAMWAAAIGAAHPVFGSILPTAEEALELGKRLAGGS